MVQTSFLLVLVVIVTVCYSFNQHKHASGRSSLAFSSQRRMDVSMIMDEFVVLKLESIKRTFNALTERLSDPDLANDRKQMLFISRERSSMEPTVLAYDEWKQLDEERLGLVEMEQDSSSDQDIKDMSRQVSRSACILLLLVCFIIVMKCRNKRIDETRIFPNHSQ